ncbi:MAG: thiamine phosphate synthase [Eubacteriaceae bacterium]|nr:thiamine phosphate synthase [Eubacteriaceae bacterium]
MMFTKEMLLLYGITDRGNEDEGVFYNQIEAALKGGATLLQLREKNMPYEDFVKEAIRVKEICNRYNVPLIINDNPEVALKSGADGVHVGIDDTPVREIREKSPEGFIIGATAKTLQQAIEAEKAGADYIGVGAVFPSPTKKNAIRITGEQLREICEAVSIPAVAIGGITLENMSELTGCGMEGIAVVSAIFGAEDIVKATELLKEKARKTVRK